MLAISKFHLITFLIFTSSCTQKVNYDEQKLKIYIKKEVSFSDLNTDSLISWIEHKGMFTKKDIFDQIRSETVIKTNEKFNDMNIILNENIYKVKRKDILTIKRTNWSIYYNKKYGEFLFVKIDNENPLSTVYFSTSPELKATLIRVVSDSHFVLNKLYPQKSMKFIPTK